MLAPNLKYAEECISDVCNNVLNADKLSSIGSSVSVRMLIDEPQWISVLRTRIEKLKVTSDEWTAERPDILEKVMTPFINYSNSFKAVSENISKLNKDELIILFTNLKDSAKKAKTDSIKKSQYFKNWISDINNEMKLIDDSIEDGWSEIGKDEEKAITLVKSISELQTEMTALEDSITPGILSSEEEFYKSFISITFEIALDTMSVPYLSFLGLFVTEGQMFINLYENTNKIDELIKEICKEQIELSHTSQALAESKALIKFLYDLTERVLKINSVFDNITNIWTEQIDDLNNVISLLNNGVDTEDIIDIQLIKAASEIWGNLSGMAYKVIIGPNIGTPFEIEIGNDN